MENKEKEEKKKRKSRNLTNLRAKTGRITVDAARNLRDYSNWNKTSNIPREKIFPAYTFFFPSILAQLRGNKFQDERSRVFERLLRGVARKNSGYLVYLTFIVIHRKNEELFHS